ncbi:hypothetical protein AVV36_gp084 [Pectobacterium bacteriophage PM2]|uniref:Uncharacterized protein n=1 Tax=Pectobacterium bacteriophage PM2 TaxID=1429794 RepID=A0A0A0Q0D3_9CAUD|nr:hypothetical protein AVV36_gp084 [Pectobacterium bacteriophage PM2]AHY25046.1 hypothetical protein PM2_084 [Pectobacterium bacteriophage PM2]
MGPEISLVILYTVIGIGYAKTLIALTKSYSSGDAIGFLIFGVLLWPLLLIVASVWNFSND